MNERSIGTFLILTADDFGRSLAVNGAVEEAARQGVLRCASLMINGDAADDAVKVAKNIPSLQVALHLSLTEGNPVSPEQFIPSLLTRDGYFKGSPTRMGLALQFDKAVQRHMEIEVAAQFRRFSETGLPFFHVDCHHHLHVHPRLFETVLENSIKYGLKSIRIPYEPWDISGPICKGHTIRNLCYRKVFTKLCSKCREKIRSAGLLSCQGVFGIYQSGQITEDWILMLLDRLEAVSYTHLRAHET